MQIIKDRFRQLGLIFVDETDIDQLDIVALREHLARRHPQDGDEHDRQCEQRKERAAILSDQAEIFQCDDPGTHQSLNFLPVSLRKSVSRLVCCEVTFSSGMPAWSKISKTLRR
jgi:hypothetical protein